MFLNSYLNEVIDAINNSFVKPEQKTYKEENSIDDYVKKMNNKYNTDKKYSEQVSEEVLSNVNALVNKYYDNNTKDLVDSVCSLGLITFIGKDKIESAAKENNREFLCWVFTQL